MTALLQEVNIEPGDGFSEAEINHRLKAIIEIRLEEIQTSRVKISIAGREVDLKKSVRRSIETVLSVKDLVTTAVSSEFHASLAWVGVLIFLNPIPKAVKQSDDATEGFAKISDLLAQYKVIEGFQIDDDLSEDFVLTAAEAKKKPRVSLRENVVKLYAAILDYHIRLAKHFSRSGFFRALEDLRATDDWQSMLDTVTNIHDSISGILRTIRHDMLQGVDHKLGELKRELEKSRKDMQEIKHNTESTNQEQLFKKLNAAQLAVFNAQFRHKTGDVCLKDTQLQIIREIRHWCDESAREVLYLLKGMAGTGKSTISRTLATACQDRQPLVDGLPLSNSTVLGGSVFFNERMNDQNHG
ncbi:hypothetical protein N7493_001305 [Penicillium malachiteum]|uniref:NWD NACHT-NTPase N-terminal domain-containing protein n=1 Tax=Penicillium malachiteum TaxID=1324776 RepID=A0AAD6MZP4_9EURO|nr:hypothetical protein N7493_001305 [Penicillium malachiteum]